MRKTFYDDCEEPIYENDIIILNIGHIGIDLEIKNLCRTCAEDNYFECDECKQTFPIMQKFYDDTGEYCICNKCAKNL